MENTRPMRSPRPTSTMQPQQQPPTSFQGMNRPVQQTKGNDGTMVVQQRSIVMPPAMLQQYTNWRSEAYEAEKKLSEQKSKYDEYKRDVMDRLDAQYYEKTSDLTEQLEQTKDKIELAQRAALRQLQRQEASIKANTGITREQKVATIERLRKEYVDAFYPDDEYEKHTKENSIEGLIESLFGGMFPGMGSMMSQGAPISSRMITSSDPTVMMGQGGNVRRSCWTTPHGGVVTCIKGTGCIPMMSGVGQYPMSKGTPMKSYSPSSGVQIEEINQD